MELPPRIQPSTAWCDQEIHRLQCALDVANSHHVVLVNETIALRKALFEERAANRVVDGGRLSLDELAEKFDDVLTTAKARVVRG